ncbi:MAG: phytoene desaturase [Candidatus Lokiarchaeota archaeon]|nr:phytoene desaturase [Candidatus Lokiarchaeota archaeon]MBD3200988.1 phytoene desaturase [Candidatus Lokiarchaeota archaeon]
MKKAAIVGAGLGGLSASINLASKGWDVDVYEVQSFPGGKAAEEYLDGFRFDIGPSLVTMPWVFKDVFETAGKDVDQELTIIKLKEICTYYLSDGTYLKAWSDLEKFGTELEKLSEGSHRSLQKYLKEAEKAYKLGGELFLTKPIHEVRTLLKLSTLSKLIRFAGIHPISTLNKINSKFFEDPRLVQLFNRYATYNGSDPFQTPATMLIIPFIEYNGGGYGIKEGIYEIPKKLYKAAVDLGVNFFFEEKVKKINIENKKITGITIKSKFRDYEVVISDADVLYTYEELLELPRAKKAKRYRKLEPSSSGIVFYWGIDQTFEQLSVNNIFFSSDYPAEFRAMFENRTMPQEPTVYVNITSKLTPSDAPDGCENWFVLINAPANDNQDWDNIVSNAREAVINLISKRLGVNIVDHIVTEGILTPPEIERRTSSTHGSLYGISSNTAKAAFFRHRNRSKDIKGLYFCGGSSHPGGGMPLVILSGKICAQLVDKYSGE